MSSRASVRCWRFGGGGRLNAARSEDKLRQLILDKLVVHLKPERRRHRLDESKLADPGGHGGIPKDRRSLTARTDLFEQLKPLRAQTVFVRHEAGGDC